MREELLKILGRIRPDCDFLTSSHFVMDQLLDSLDIVEVVASLENAYSIDVPENQIVPDNFSSLESLQKLVESLKK